MNEHQLLREGLDTEPDLERFFDRYLGDPVRRKLEGHRVQFPAWPVATRQALRELCVLVARRMPEANHVIRADVDTAGHVPQDVRGDLLLYFGLQDESRCEGARRQYIGVAHEFLEGAHVLVLYVAGSVDRERRAELIEEEDPSRSIDGRRITTSDDVAALASAAGSVFETQRRRMIRQRFDLAVTGMCPCVCQRNWRREARRTEEAAAGEVSAYWMRRRAAIDEDQARVERSRMAENNRYRYSLAVAYVLEGLAVEEAYALALSEQA
jgi:hypothetical protein